MGLNAWAAVLFAVAIILSLAEFSRTKSLRDLSVSLLGAGIAVAFFAQGVSPLLHP